MAEGGKKRPAEDAGGTPNRKRSLNPLTWFSSPAREEGDDLDDIDEDDGNTQQPDQRTVKERIDTDFAALEEERLVKDAAQSGILDFDLSITPRSNKWIKQRKQFQDALSKDSVLNVLNKYFAPSQRLLIEPPLYAGGSTLEIQKLNKEEYERAMKEGDFKGEKNNLITKLTMLRFGLPVEALTLNNVLNAGEDEEDPEDGEAELPRVQKIMFVEKPLEFLDKYYERGHGYPMLRLKGPRQARPTQPPPLPPFGSVRMRGGASRDAAKDYSTDTRYLYSHYGGRGVLETKREDRHPSVSSEEFKATALAFLGLDENDDWAFVVDQYNNQEANKNNMLKPFVKSFPVTKRTYERRYREYIKPRVSNTLNDWVMVIGASRSTDAPPTFKLPTRDSMGNPAAPTTQIPAASANIPSPTKEGPKTTNQPAGDELPKAESRRVYRPDSGDFAEFTDSLASFQAALKKLWGLPAGSRPKTMKLDFYSNQLDQAGQAQFHHHVDFPWTESQTMYTNEIASRIFDRTGWNVAASEKSKNGFPPEPFWPPWNKVTRTYLIPPAQVNPPEVKPRARIYGPDDKPSTITNNSRRFLAAARTRLQLDTSQKYAFRVELHSLQLNRQNADENGRLNYQFSHYIDVDQDNLDQMYSDFISQRLFELGDDWFIRVVEAHEDNPFPAPHSLPAVGQSTEPSPNAVPPMKTNTSGGKSSSDGPKQYTKPDTASQQTCLGAKFSDHGFIYGYAGMIWTRNDESIFRGSVLRLLNIDPESDWWFWATIYKDDGKVDDKIALQKSNFSQNFPNLVKSRDVIGNWLVFFHIGAMAPPTARDKSPSWDAPHPIVIQDPLNEICAYWDIPADLTMKAYGVNQLQPGFFRAMQVHFPPGWLRSHDMVELNGYELGFGGMELTQELLERLIADYRTRAGRRLEYKLNPHPNKNNIHANDIGIRLAGCNRLGKAPSGAYAKVRREIQTMSDSWLQAPIPDRFRLWKTAAARESRGNSTVIGYNDPDRGVRIKALLDTDVYRTNCIWFRPEYTEFTITDLDSPNKSVVWDIAAMGSDLSAFRDVLEIVFGQKDAAESFEIIGPRWNSKLRLVVNKSTSELEWQRDIFDWFQGNQLWVKRSNGIDFVINTTEPRWGQPEVPCFPPGVILAPTPPPPPKEDIVPVTLPDNGPPLQPPHHRQPAQQSSSWSNNTTAGSTTAGDATNQPRVPRVHPAPPIQFNQERIVKPQAAEQKPHKFDPWQAEQNRLDRLQRESYLKDQYAIQPGQKPEPPAYGKPRDLLLSISSNLPQVYLKRLTPTDIAQLEEENRRIRMRNLERQSACAMCNEAFPAYKPEDIIAHYKEHADALAAAGRCPICETERWVFMDMDHKRQHIFDHFERIESDRIKDFWADLQCPVCAADLHEMNARDVLYHIAAHTPDVIRFCDRCGLDLDACNILEKAHHEAACHEWQAGEDHNTPPIFCGSCGRDRTMETEQQRRNHWNNCRPPTDESCIKCGIELTKFSPEDYQNHENHCRSPRGWHNKWCRRCGKDLSVMHAASLSDHKRNCLSKPPRTSNRISDDPRIKDLQALIQKHRAQEAKNFSDAARNLEIQRRLGQEHQQLEEARTRFEREKAVSTVGQIENLKKELQNCHDTAKNYVGGCPFPDCAGGDIGGDTDIGHLDRQGLYNHLMVHSKNVFFNCPLEDDDGGVCNAQINVQVQGENSNIKDHYWHRGQTQGEPPVKPPGNAAAELKRLLPNFIKQSNRLAAVVKMAKERMDGARWQARTHPLSRGAGTNSYPRKAPSNNNDPANQDDTNSLNVEIDRLNAQISKLLKELEEARKKIVTEEECDQRKQDILQELADLKSRLAQTITRVECEEEKKRLSDGIDMMKKQLRDAAKDPAYGKSKKSGRKPGASEGSGGVDDATRATGGTDPGADAGGQGAGGQGSGDGNNDDTNNQGQGDDNQDPDHTGFLPSPPGGYRVRGSPKKNTVSARSATSHSKTGTKRKIPLREEEDDSYHPIPYLEVVKKARTGPGSEEDYVIAVETLSSAAPRRSTRVTSGTPAPSLVGGPALVVKKRRGRPRKDKDGEDESPETLGEEDEEDLQVAAKSSPRKGSRESPEKN